MPFSPNVTVRDAEAAKEARLSIGRSRRVPELPGVIEDAAGAHTFHIFNVGPWAHPVNTGSTGTYFIPACPKGKRYIEPRHEVRGDGSLKYPIPGIVSELTIKDEFEYNRLMSDGWNFCCEIVGDGRGRDQSQSLRHWGVFPSKNAEPTKDELYQAKKMLEARCAEIVREARDLYATDRKLFSQIVQRQRHFIAAEVLNLTDEPWMVEQSPSTRVKCRYCGTMNDGEAVKCAKCLEVIDLERYRRLKEQDEAIIAGSKAAKE